MDAHFSVEGILGVRNLTPRAEDGSLLLVYSPRWAIAGHSAVQQSMVEGGRREWQTLPGSLMVLLAYTRSQGASKR